MKVAYRIAQALKNTTAKGFLLVINRIGTVTVALGLATVLLSFMIFSGFQEHIREKLFVFSGHLSLTQYNIIKGAINASISQDTHIINHLQSFTQVKNIYTYSFKNALLQSEEGFSGALLKGVPVDSSYPVLKNIIKTGRFLKPNFKEPKKYLHEIVVSQKLANQLGLELGHIVKVFFMDKKPRMRKLKVIGIYQTYIEEYDKVMAFVDNKLISRLNNWGDSLVGGYEIYLKDFNTLDQTYKAINSQLDYKHQLLKITDKASHYFEWFNVLGKNVYILLIIILIVVFFNNIAVISILSINLTQTIGLLKALGSRSWMIQQIFFFIGGRLILKGIIIGNLLALGLGFFQKYTQFITLDPQNYFLKTVPINIDFQNIIFINIFMSTVLALTLLLSTLIILTIRPIQALRFA